MPSDGDIRAGTMAASYCWLRSARRHSKVLMAVAVVGVVTGLRAPACAPRPTVREVAAEQASAAAPWEAASLPRGRTSVVGSRGILSMPTTWTTAAMEDLVARGIVGRPAAGQLAWDKQVTRGEATGPLKRAFAGVDRTVPEGDVIPGSTGQNSPLTRLDFARSLDSLLGSPALPPLPPELAAAPREAETDPDWGLHTPEQLRHPEVFKLFSDLDDPADRALVHRMAWWLIIRPPQHHSVDSGFHPGAPVTWGEFVVCLDRAVMFLKPRAPDTSTPEGVYAALLHAFWKADFTAADRYLAAGNVRGPGSSLREELRTVRFTFVDAQELMDSRVTGVKKLGRGKVRLGLDYIPQWGDHDTGTVTMQRQGATWVVVDAE